MSNSLPPYVYWDYLSSHQQDLIRQGSYLYQEIFKDGQYSFSDYSFIVFPFAKAYEGYLKKFFLDMGYISQHEYHSDHIRLGRLLSPHLVGVIGTESLYHKLVVSIGQEIADSVWNTWKFARNQVFHYYPHNELSLSLSQAKERIDMILVAIETTFKHLRV